MAYLEEEDSFKSMIMSLLIKRTMELKSEWDDDLATRIANKVGKVING